MSPLPLATLLLACALLFNHRAAEQLLTTDGRLENPLYLGAVFLMQGTLVLTAAWLLSGRRLPVRFGGAAVLGLLLLGTAGAYGSFHAYYARQWRASGLSMTDRLALIADHTTMYKIDAERRYPRNRMKRAVFDLLEWLGVPDTRAMQEEHIRDADLAMQHGDTREAIRVLARLRKARELAGLEPDVIDEGLRDRLAMAYLRIGEQDNCIQRHTPFMCYLPLPEQGIYTLGDGSRAAIREFSDILADHPDDLSTLWLLNLAYMTLGKYPQDVPAQWLIPPARFASAQDFPTFEDAAGRLGVDVESISGGSILDDFNGDGRLDLVVSAAGLHDQLRYFEGSAKGGFIEHTKEAGLTGQFGGLNITHADYDNDGDLDVLVLRGAWLLFDNGSGNHPNSLLRNNGDGTFTDVTEAAGLLSFHATQVGVWGDYDNDGWVDLFIGNESSDVLDNPPELYHNNGDGTFSERAAAAGLHVRGMIKGAAWGDYDNDGRLDLYVSLLGSHNVLYHNDGGKDVHFSEVTAQAGVAEPVFSFPTWFFDYDNDGWLDLFVGGFGGPYPQGQGYDAGGNESHVPYDDAAAPYFGRQIRYSNTPRLYRNRGDGTFADVSADVGLEHITLVMGANHGDIDNDGFEDIYLGTGSASYRSLMPNVLLRSDQARRFVDVTTAARVGHLQKGHGISIGDVDGDGDSDIYAELGGWYAGDVFRNALYLNPGNAHHWITLKLAGRDSNCAAIGARATLHLDSESGPRMVHRVVDTGGSFGDSSLQLEIGLGDARAIERIEIDWPATGRRQVIERPPMDAPLEVREPAGRSDLGQLAPSAPAPTEPSRRRPAGCLRPAAITAHE